YDTLQQLSHTLVSTKKLVQYLAIYGNLVLGHPLQPPVGFVDQLNHYQEGDGPSYCYAILILEFTPSYRTLLRVVRRTRQISDPVILYRGLSGASIAETAILVNDGHLLYRSRPLECWTFSKDQACEFVVSQTHEPRRTYDGVIIEAVFNIDDVWI